VEEAPKASMPLKLLKNALKKTGYTVTRVRSDVEFRADYYMRHNARRLEHLASLRIPVAGMSVLEVGAGIGDHSHYYFDRGCRLVITEGRPENIQYLKERYTGADIRRVDLENPEPLNGSPFDVVHCYGLLYHLRTPKESLEFMARNCKTLLLLETCVSFGADEQINPVAEAIDNPTQAVSGTGCRPTRLWIFNRLREQFRHVYVPRTQPNHSEFPIDWTAPDLHRDSLSRAIFIASRVPLDNPLLADELIDRQHRHE
jgi:SAM-dependent methyltransferase